MGHGIAPLISRSALTSSPNGIPCPTPQVTRVRTVNVPVARWFPPQACMPAFRQRGLQLERQANSPLPTAPTKEKVAINISVDRDLLAGRARGEGGNGGRSPHQRAISEGVPGKSKRFRHYFQKARARIRDPLRPAWAGGRFSNAQPDQWREAAGTGSTEAEAEGFRKNGRAGSRETIRLPAQDPGKSWSYAITRRWPRVALRWKNSAWLTTADTVAGWNGLAIRKAGSGRCPVRKRSG